MINTSSWKHHEYRVGVEYGKKYKVVLNSDRLSYAGFGITNYMDIFETSPSNNFELLDKEIILPVLAPYGIVVLKEVN